MIDSQLEWVEESPCPRLIIHSPFDGYAVHITFVFISSYASQLLSNFQIGIIEFI